MATATTTTTTTTATTTKAHLKVQSQPTKPKRRNCRETTISSSAATTATAIANSNNSDSVSASGYSSHTQSRKLERPNIVSPDNSWCCPASIPISAPSPPPQPCRLTVRDSHPFLDSPSTFKIRFSPGSLSPVMDFTPNSASTITGTTTLANGNHSPHEPSSFPSSFTKFNTALTAGLLNPMSPPPDKPRSSPTLFEMMASEPEMQPRNQIPINNANVTARSSQNPQMSVQDKQTLIMQRIADILGNRSPGNQFNDASSSDVKLTLSSKDGISVSMSVHRQILVAHSRFFAMKLSDRWAKLQRSSGPYVVEIADCDDVEVYIETLRLMYCKDLRRKLMKEDVSRVLGILKVSVFIYFIFIYLVLGNIASFGGWEL